MLVSKPNTACHCVRSLFLNKSRWENKAVRQFIEHGGGQTVQAVQRIADMLKKTQNKHIQIS